MFLCYSNTGALMSPYRITIDFLSYIGNCADLATGYNYLYTGIKAMVI